MKSYQLLERLFFIFLLSNYFPINHAQLEDNTRPEVTIPQGILLGKTLTSRNDRNISAFLGIPYAQPPIGDLRFANPVEAVGWNGIRDASVDSNICAQISSEVVVGDEDCLYINVYTPEITNSSLLPVMVYIHGGGFQTGSARSTLCGPEFLLDADVVLVAPNHRLASLGFLSTGDEIASGNWGLKDQVLALEWVRDNVAYFGGDPDRVTIFGESAGAASVHLLSLSDTTVGLFHRYITQSGSALASWVHNPRAAYSSRAFELGEYVGCKNETSDSLISCLRTKNFTDIMATDAEFVLREPYTMIWGPTDEPDFEGAFLTDSPTNLFAAGKIRDLPWMSGVNQDEGLIFTASYYADQELANDLLANIDTDLAPLLSWTYQSDSGAAWIKAVKSYYFNDDFTSNMEELLANLTILVGDSMFYYPARKALEQQNALASSPQYFYTFNYRGTHSYTSLNTGTTVNYGVAHADDLIYLFPRVETFSFLNETMSETDNEMVDKMVQLWTSFAINGTPTASALIGTTGWEPYSSADGYLRIGNNSDTALEVQYSFLPERMQFWTDLDAASSEDSGTADSSPNLLHLLLVACSQLLLSAATPNRLG